MKNSTIFKHGTLSLPVLVGLLFIASPILSGYAAPSPTGTAVPTAKAETLGQKLQPPVAAKLKELQVPGAVFFVQSSPTDSWAANLGVSDLATHALITSSMHFRIGSITKTFVATVILQLVDEGKIRLNDPLSKYEPTVPNGANITIREALNMTSGLYNYSEDAGFDKTLNAEISSGQMNRIWSPQELLAIAFKQHPYFAPGKGLHYSNTNYILLGLIIEKITGHPVQNEIQQRILTPLGMSNTIVPANNSSAIPSPYSHGYTFLTPSSQAVGKQSAAASAPIDATLLNPSWAWTAGDMISTEHDLQIWAKALATGKLLSATTQKERLTWLNASGTAAPSALSYGLGIADFNGFIGHNGALPGFQSFMVYMPQKNQTIIVLTNLNPTSSNAAPADVIGQLIIQKLAT